MMIIVVLDGYTLNPGDLSWKELEVLGDCTIHDRTKPEEVFSRIKNADIVLTNKTPISGDVIQNLPQLKYIGIMATGYNIVDTEAAEKKKIPVTNVPTYGTMSVAQMTMALVLELAQNVGKHSHMVNKGYWSRSKDWCFWDKPLIELNELTLGIIGFGRIGKKTAEIASAFGMQIIAFNPEIPANIPEWARFVEMDTIFKESDIISLHCPLTAETEKFIDKKRISLMKRTALLINTSRGQLINEIDLAEALNKGRIAGAGLDVLSVEPPQDNPLLTAKNCIITPHIAWATKAARIRLMEAIVNNLKAFLDGKKLNLVN